MFILFIFTFHGFISNRPNDQLPVGLFVSSVGRALHRYCRGHRVRIPYRPDFFRLSFTTAKVVSITTMIFFISNSCFPQFKYMIFIYSFFSLYTLQRTFLIQLNHLTYNSTDIMLSTQRSGCLLIYYLFFSK